MLNCVKLVALCFVFSGGTVLLYAQTAELSGFIKDRSGSTIPGARVELRNQEKGTRYRTNANSEGLYSIPGLRPGTYDATVQADGFRTFTHDGILLNVGDRAGLNFSLELSGVSSSITVSAGLTLRGGAPTPEGAAVGTLVDQEFVSNMPLNGRSFQSLIHLSPGVVVTRSTGATPGQFNVNGQRSNANYVMVDGVSANFGASPYRWWGQSVSGAIPTFDVFGGTNGLVSVDAMQEFRIQTSSFAPEYGRTPGAQISIITRSGSNAIHGSVFEYVRNDLFDARNWFNVVPQPKPPLRQNDFGATLGGPIRENQTFFFFSYEGLRLREPQTWSWNVLTVEARAKAAPVYQALVNALPIPNGPVNPDGISAKLTGAFSNPSRLDATSFRIDHQVTDRVTVFGRYNHAPSSQGSRMFSQLMTDSSLVDTVTGGATILFTPRLVNDFRANWSRALTREDYRIESTWGAIAPPDSALFGEANNPESSGAVFSVGSNGSVRVGNVFRNIQRQINLVDTFSIIRGLHQLKFGVDYRRMQPTSPQARTYIAYIDSESLRAGTVYAISRETYDPITVRLHNTSLFAQDIWKLSERLTLTYGLRWEINTAPASVTKETPLYSARGLFGEGPLGMAPGELWSTRYGNVAPRVGAAWRSTQNSVVRGGFGLFYDLGYGAQIPLSTYYPYGRYGSVEYKPAIPFDPNGAAFGPLPASAAIAPRTILPGVDPHLRSPLTYQWNVAWERTFGERQALAATYVGAWGTNLLRRDYVLPPGSLFTQTGSFVNVTYNSGHSRYSALQVQFLRRMSRGLQALVSYAWSKSSDTISTDNASFNGNVNSSVTELFGTSMMDLIAQAPPLAPSDFDRRQLVSMAISWDLPAPRKLGRRLLKGWTLDSMLRAQSAPPLNVVYAVLDPRSFYIQADVVPGQPFWIPNANQPRGRVVNPAAFRAPAGRNGNFPRNSIRGFPFSQAEAALRRKFHLSEKLSLDLRAEYFNVFNHPNFASPDTLLGGGTMWPFDSFGKVGKTFNVVLGGGGTSGGQAKTFAPGGPRSAQFSVRLSF